MVELASRDAVRGGRRQSIALAACVGLTAALALYLSYRNRDFQFDDGLIYQRYVRNWLAGAGLVYNPGERFNGLTSPLFGYVVMAAAAVLRDVQLAVCVVSGTALAATIGLFAAVFARAAGPLGAVLGALLVACCRYFYITFGMETTLFIALIGLALWLFDRGDSFLLGIALALLVATRFEGALLVPALAVEHFRQGRRLPPPAHFILPIVILSAIAAFNSWYYGAPLPATVMAKLYQGSSGYWGGWKGFFDIGYQVPLVFSSDWSVIGPVLLLGIVGVVAVGGASLNRIALSFLGLTTAFYLVFRIPNYHWYYAPYYAFGMFYAGAGASLLIGRLAAGPRLVRPAALAVLALALYLPARSLAGTLPTLGQIGSEIYRSAGLWLAANTPADATVAAVEIGFIGWYSDRPIIDILGLVNPLNAAAVGRRDLFAWLTDYSPDYILVHQPPSGFEVAAIDAEAKGEYAAEPHFAVAGLRLLRRTSAPR
jgi:hypothetical protein